MTQNIDVELELDDRNETATLRRANVNRKACCRCGEPIKKGQWMELTTIGAYKVWCHEGCEPRAMMPKVDMEEITGHVVNHVGKLIDSETWQNTLTDKLSDRIYDGVRALIEGEDYQKTLADKLGPVVSDGVAGAVSDFVAETVKLSILESTKAVMQYVDEKCADKPVERIEIRNADSGRLLVAEELVHQSFGKVVKLAARRKNIFLPGPSGCGKSHLAGQVAKALELPFGMISLSGGVSEAKLVGRTLPNVNTGEDNYNPTDFVRLYENGGVFLFDELDASDPNVLIVINSALANGRLALDRRENPVAERHPDFIAIAAANTYGRGADRQYVGRAPLDEATLDRFRIGTVPMDYDPRVEAALCPDGDLRETLLAWREQIRVNRLERVMSTRFMADAYDMLANGGFTMADVEEAFFAGWREDERRKVLSA